MEEVDGWISRVNLQSAGDRANNPERCFSPSWVLCGLEHVRELLWHPRLHSNSVSEVKLCLLFFLDFPAWLSCEQDLYHHNSINTKCWLSPKLWSNYWEDGRGRLFVRGGGGGGGWYLEGQVRYNYTTTSSLSATERNKMISEMEKSRITILT